MSARLNSDKSDGPFVDYLHALNADQPPDLIVAIGAPAANFVQRHRTGPFSQNADGLHGWWSSAGWTSQANGIRHRRGEFDTMSAFFFENILRVLPLTKTIAVVVGASPNETFWLEARRRETAPLAERVEFRWYNELSFEDMLKDAADASAPQCNLLAYDECRCCRRGT